MLDIQLQGAYLAEVNLEGAYLVKANLENATFRRSSPSGGGTGPTTEYGVKTNLRKANLSMANLSGTDLFDCDLSESNLEFANLRNANISESNLFKANLYSASMKEARIYESYLVEANLKHANLESADLTSSFFENAIMEGANLSGADLSYSNLRKADLTRVKASFASFVNSDLYGVKLLEANLEFANLSRSDLRSVNLANSTLRGANISRAVIDGNTVLLDCDVDKNTDFTESGINNAIVSPKTVTALQNNMRRISWEDWYAKNTGIKSYTMKLFWSISNYGSESLGIVKALAIAVAFFFTCYLAISYMTRGILSNMKPPFMRTNTVKDLSLWSNWICKVVCFSIASMVTLGYGGVNIKWSYHYRKTSIVAMVLIIANLLTGYFLLAVVVTRIGIIFTSLSP